MKQKNKLNNELKNYCISFKKFLIMYCGVDIEYLENLKISHKDIKQLIPDLKRVSFEDVYKDVRSLYIGKIVIVKDSYGDIAPYVCPKLDEELKFELPEQEKDDLQEIANLVLNENLNLYQLNVIRNKLKTAKKFKEYRAANKILKSKIDFKVKRYKKQKQELIGERERYEY